MSQRIPDLSRLLLAAFLLGCGGKAQTSGNETENAAGSEGTILDSCPELEASAAESLRALVSANNDCETDRDCTTATGIGDCYTYCVVPVRRSDAAGVIEAGRELCRKFVESGCHVAVTCPNPPATTCSAGTCAFEF
jgi:hypothetical protein